MSSRGSHTSGGTYDNERIAVEDAIVAQLRELDLVGARNKPLSEDESYELKVVMEEVTNLIERDEDETRRGKLIDLVAEAHKIRRLILYLRGLAVGDAPPHNYYEHAMMTLEKVTTWTYDGEYRKAAIILGVVEAGAEMLIMEVRVWGPRASIEMEYVKKGRNERRDVRKQIASVLTNLTFGSASMKRLIAEYDGFIPVVIQLIEHAPNLVPSYANLLRNVSWPSCKGMPSLYAACLALARAAVEANLRKGRDDDKSVKSTLSAIWNIVGSGGEECVRAVVEEDGCIQMMIGLLTQDAHRTLIVEYATGILKHAAVELVRGERMKYMQEVRSDLVHSLLPLLRGSSLTIVKNALTAVNEMAAKDPVTVANCMSALGLDSLEKLQRSNDNEMRRPAKEILSRIGAGGDCGVGGGGMMSRSAHVGGGREMTSSMRPERLLPRRSPFCSPALGGGIQQHHVMLASGHSSSSLDPSSSTHRASSLPRHFTPNHDGRGGGGMSSSLYGGTQYTMGSPSPLYGNMDTIRAAQQQQQLQLAQQHKLQMQQHQRPAPPPFPGVVAGGAAAAASGTPLGFPTSFAPPPGAAAAAAPPTSFASTSFAPPPSGAYPASSGGQQASFGGATTGPPTLQYGDGGGGGEIDDESFFDDDEDEMSTQVTRAGSILSMEEEGAQSQDISGFHSTVETANNSARLSPVSYSDLPDSPTQCAALRDQAMQLHLPAFPLATSTLNHHHQHQDSSSFFPPSSSVPPLFMMGGTGGGGASSSADGSSSGGLSSSQTNSSHTTPHATSAEQTPTFASLNARYTTMDYDGKAGSDAPHLVASAADSAPSTSRDGEDDDDYGVYGEGDDLLDRSIQEALPQRIEEKRERLNSFLLDSISSALPSTSSSPSSKTSSRYSNTNTLREDDYLAAAIESAMPKMGSLSSPRGTLLHHHHHQSKNGQARWSEEQLQTTAEGHVMMMTMMQYDEEESDESEDEGPSGMGGSLVGEMPRDVEEEMEAERIAIDCSSMKRKPRPPRSSHLPRHAAAAAATPAAATPTRSTARQATPSAAGGGVRSSPRPSSIGRPRPLTSTPASSKSRLNKFPPTPRVSAVSLASVSLTPNGNSHHVQATPPSSSAPSETPPIAASPAPSTSSSVQSTPSSMSRLKKPTASAVVSPYNYQKPKPNFPAREEKKGGKDGKEVVEEQQKSNGKILVTTV